MCPFSNSCANPGDGKWIVGEVLYEVDFEKPLNQWRAELEEGGRVETDNGKLVIDVPRGCSVWFEPMLAGPVMIEYEATVIGKDGPNDRVSDLNCFWMAHDVRNEDDFFAVERSGQFADYNQLKCYYVGLRREHQQHDPLPPIHRRCWSPTSHARTRPVRQEVP